LNKIKMKRRGEKRRGNNLNLKKERKKEEKKDRQRPTLSEESINDSTS